VTLSNPTKKRFSSCVHRSNNVAKKIAANNKKQGGNESKIDEKCQQRPISLDSFSLAAAPSSLITREAQGYTSRLKLDTIWERFACGFLNLPELTCAA